MVAQRIDGLAWKGAAGSGGGLSAGLFGLMFGLADTVALWRDRRRQRLALAAMPGHVLRDIGVSPFEARAEAIKPFWRA